MLKLALLSSSLIWLHRADFFKRGLVQARTCSFDGDDKKAEASDNIYRHSFQSGGPLDLVGDLETNAVDAAQLPTSRFIDIRDRVARNLPLSAPLERGFIKNVKLAALLLNIARVGQI